MGFLTDDEMSFDVESQNADTPPGSPRLAATRAQAIAANFVNAASDISNNVACNYAALCCKEFGLNDLDKDDILKVSQMHPHLIAVRQYARVVALNHSVIQLLTESFLESVEFKDHVTRQIQATFLDPAIPSYVRGCTSCLIQHMQENLSSWHIPPIVHAHFLNSKAFRKAVAAIASNFRGDIRRKIIKSIIDKLDIGALAKKICIKGYQPTNDLWRRLALLLAKLEAQCTKPTKEITLEVIQSRIKANLKNDQQLYPGPASGRTKLPNRIHVPDWQKDHAKAVQDMLDYTVEASPDEDEDEDDSADPPEGSDAQVGAQASTSRDEDSGHENDTGNGGRQEPGPEAQDTPQGTHPDHHPQGNRIGCILVPETQASSSSISQPGSTPATSRTDGTSGSPGLLSSDNSRSHSMQPHLGSHAPIAPASSIDLTG
ncbi:hypothetical protein FRC06_000725 [Ceratobasidium sp. 370]|nr:hypothetical protein FRC06_000725 [Ceratobasidium sp. 370]